MFRAILICGLLILTALAAQVSWLYSSTPHIGGAPRLDIWSGGGSTSLHSEKNCGFRPIVFDFCTSALGMKIKVDDLTGPEIIQLLQAHLQNLSAISPPCSMHALNLDALRQPNITFWSVWNEAQLMGCGALKALDAEHAEIKSMRTAAAHLRKGVASHLLAHIIAEARRRNFRRLSLETGAGSQFAPAQALYTKFGFRPCGPFAEYREDPNSLFMTMELRS